MNDTAITNSKLALARTLLTKGGALESSNGSEKIKSEELTEALENTFREDSRLSNRTPSVTAKAAASLALTHAESALNKTANDGSPSNLTDLEVSALEAIIEATGRPALRYSNGNVQTPPTALGENSLWQVLVVTARNDINTVSRAVGRIAIGLADSLGTGWRIGDDLLVTNRHVVAQMVSNSTDPVSTWKLDASKKPYVDFAVTDGAQAAQRFKIAELVYVATEPSIDVAFLRASSETSQLPPSLLIDWSKGAPGRNINTYSGAQIFQGRQIYVVGHPYRQGHTELVTSVFGVADGMKRCSPGRVTRLDDPDPHLEHDCSTLGGNSGSCVFASDTHEVIGVHVGGVDVDDNTAKGSANLALALCRLTGHHVGEIMQAGKV